MEGLLQYIDQIDQTVVDAEIDVMESLIESYDKSIMILENCDETTDLSAFDIFQEGEKWDKFKEDTKAPVFGKKGEGLAKRLLMIIPRLIQKLVALIRKLFTKNKSFEQKMDKDVDNLKKQAQTVVPEQLSEEQAKNLANKINEARASSQAASQSERDFKSKRDDVMDSIDKRHEQLRESIRDSEKSFQSKMDDLHNYTRSINDPFGNSKALEELGKMINDDGPVFKSITPETVEKIDNKNPGLIDDLLEELGSPARKKEKMAEKYFTIKNTKFFNFDKSDSEFSSLPYSRFVLSFNVSLRMIRDVCEDSEDLDYSKIAEFSNKLKTYLIPEIEDSTKRLSHSYMFNGTVKVQYSDIVKAVEKMDVEIKKILSELNKCIDNIEKLHPNIKKRIDQLHGDEFDKISAYNRYDRELGVLNVFIKELIGAVDHLITYRTTIQTLWDQHIKVINDAIRLGRSDVTFTMADTFEQVKKYADKYYK